MKDNDFAIVGQYNTAIEAEMAKSLLESAGIKATIENEIMSSLYPTGVIPTKLLVRTEDYNTAMQVIGQR